MENLSIQEWLAAAVIALFLLAKAFRLLGWDKGVYVADELRDALQDASMFIVAARAGGSTVDIERAATTAASKVRGIDTADVRPIIENLVERGVSDRYGVSVSLDNNGDIRLDPSGAVNKAGHKLSKWVKKVF